MYEYQREELVNSLRRKGIRDEAVLAAMLLVERHLFVPEALRGHSYRDSALPIGYGQTISQPYTVAFMTESLEAKKGNKILEIGTGSGYQAAVLEKMGMLVYSIERNDKLYFRTQKLLESMDLRIGLLLGDGTLGWEDHAPYDGIIVTAGSPVVPERLKKQLKIGGKMVVPVGDRQSQALKILTKISEERFDIVTVPNFAFVPLIGLEGWKEEPW